jgi:probable rRNA maturation factor
MTVEIRAHQKIAGRIDRARLKRVAQKTLRAEKSSMPLAIYITTDAEIHQLNRAFHATDAPTDVLSFPMDDGGDIAISYETAKRQAHDAGWRIADEIELLTVHGILHLLGYDDLTPRQRARMWKRQAQILGRKIQ